METSLNPIKNICKEEEESTGYDDRASAVRTYLFFYLKVLTEMWRNYHFESSERIFNKGAVST